MKVAIGCVAVLVGCALLLNGAGNLFRSKVAPRDQAMPHYQHIFVIIGENKSFEQLYNHPEWVPNLRRFATEYGSATRFYAEVHPSEGNYVAMLGGDTFGIHDDDAFFCRAGSADQSCPNADGSAYSGHTVTAPSLMDQLTSKGLSWKAYLEDLQAGRPLLPSWPPSDSPSGGRPANLYASKHNGFLNFRSISQSPPGELARHFSDFTQLDSDLAHGTMPNYAQIVPNECNDMHGLTGDNVPEDCRMSDLPALVKRGDAAIGALVTKIMRSRVWSGHGNAAIVITFDESDGSETASEPHGCCGSDPNSIANFGGGHIPTIVITNHGPRHLVDATPYNHYSLLRSTELAFQIHQFLGHAGDRDGGVVAMTPLFALPRQ